MNRSLALLLSLAMLLSLSTACARADSPSASSQSLDAPAPPQSSPAPAPFAEEAPPVPEEELGQSSVEYLFARELWQDRREELLALIGQRMESYRDGSFEEMPNHHPPYPDKFPDPALLPVSYAIGDIFIGWRAAQKTQDPNVLLEGAVAVIVPLDDTRALVLEPARFHTEDDRVILGFGSSGYVDVTELGFSDLPRWLLDAQGFALDGVMGQE